MGAWGTGIFDNDGAADWAGGLDNADTAERPDLVRSALLAVIEADDDLDNDAATEGLAAAAVVAARLPGGPDVDHNYGPNVETLADLRLDADLIGLALEAIERVLAEGSEWRELWEDGGEIDRARADVQPVATALRSSRR